MNNESLGGMVESGEGSAGRDVLITGTVVENALRELHDVDPTYSVEGASQDQLNHEIFRLARQAGKAETPEEEQKLLQEADALGKIRDLSRPNNSIAEVAYDEKGNISGMKVRIKELNKNP